MMVRSLVNQENSARDLTLIRIWVIKVRAESSFITKTINGPMER